MRSADTTRRRRPLIVTENFLGPEIWNRPAVPIDDLDVHGDHVDGDPERGRLVLIGAWRLRGRGPLGDERRRVPQQRCGESYQPSTHVFCTARGNRVGDERRESRHRNSSTMEHATDLLRYHN